MRNPRFALALIVLIGWTFMGGSQARLVDAITAYAGAGQAALPALLSQTGLYSDIRANPKAVTQDIIPFEVNTALWSDASHKERFVTLPPGTVITPTDSDGYDFPDRTVLVKNFLLDTVVGDPATRIHIETRFLIARKTAQGMEWHGITYAWRRDQSDAFLVDRRYGLDTVLAVRVDGAPRGKRWRYPSAEDCRACHTGGKPIGGRGSLGFITPQLNRPSKANPAVNQLSDLAAKGVLKANSLAASPHVKQWAAITDLSQSLEVRARSYLAANCSHCHSQGAGTAESKHSFDYFNEKTGIHYDPGAPSAFGPYIDRPSAGGPTVPKLAYPGFPDSSYIIKRMLSRGTFEDFSAAQMPPLATYQPDSAAVQTVADWICTLGGKPAGSCKLPSVPKMSHWETVGIRGHARARRMGSPVHARFHEGGLILSGGGLSEAAEPATPVDIQGRVLDLSW